MVPSAMPLTVVSFCCFLLAFTAIGMLSARRARATSEDYLLAGRAVSPWLTGLSAVATNNSGFMFIGMLGFTYRFGVQAVWLQLGLILGDLAVWLWVHQRVRAQSGRLGVKSVPTLLGTDADGRRLRTVVLPAAALTFFFLAGYAAAQLKAGSTALTVLFGWHPWVGAILGAAIVVAYCFSGGLRASIWTDAAQAIVMLGSMLVLLGFAVAHAGGPGVLFGRLRALDPTLVQWMPDGLAFGFSLYLLGFVFAGIGAIGQPHIVVRSMAIESPDAIARARTVYFLWYVPFSLLVVATGLYGRVLLPDLLAGVSPTLHATAAEQALPQLSIQLLPDVLVGLMLAGLFAATMSTADSQVLSCSAAVTQDLAPHWEQSYLASKVATLSVATLALIVALLATDGVFDLVLSAWSALGAGLGPIIIVRAFGGPLSGGQGIAMMAAGVATVFWWDASPYADDVFKLLPGIVVPAVLYALSSAPRWLSPGPATRPS